MNATFETRSKQNGANAPGETDKKQKQLTDFGFDLKSVGTGLDHCGHKEFTQNCPPHERRVKYYRKWVKDNNRQGWDWINMGDIEFTQISLRLKWVSNTFDSP